MTWVATAVIGSAVVGAVTGQLAAKEQRKGAKAQRAQARLQAFQSSMESLRTLQEAQAVSSVSFQGSGASLESSGAQGVRSSLGASEASNQRMLAENVQLSNRYYSAMSDASRIQGIGSVAQSLIGAAGMAASVMARPPTVQPTTTLNAQDVANYGTQATPIGSTTRQPVYNTIDPFGGP